MKNKLWIVVILFVVAGSVVFFLNKSNAHSKSKETIRIIKPQMGEIRVTVSSPGTVMPKNRLEIKPPVNGRIEKVLVHEGEEVKAGDILVWMSSTDRAALLDAARGQSEKTLNYWQDVYKSIPLISPIEGEVIVGTVQPGQTVTTADSVIVLSDRLIVRAQVDETDIGKIKVKQAAVITLDAYPDVKIKATVDHIYYESKTVNNVTVYEVDLNLSDVPDFFRSGMNTNVDFLIEEKEDVLVVPLDVVRRHQGKAVVSLQGENTKDIEDREVTLGASDDKNVEIVSGLTIEDEIISKSKRYNLPKNNGGTNPFMPSRAGGGNRRQ
jgi:macrolide-specific efflux system membrane fusion protein